MAGNLVSSCIGVLALQGGFALHVDILHKLGVEAILVKTAQQLDCVDGLIIPGGESSVLLKMLNFDPKLRQALIEFHRSGKPIFGTCAGTILLAKHVFSPQQDSLGCIEIDVQRNWYGRQIDSFTAIGVSEFANFSALPMTFIRAPKIVKHTQNVKVLVTYKNYPVFVQQKNVLAATFHPELTNDLRVHEYFLNFPFVC